jgi:cell division septum initiation protein DivIVA
VQDQSAGNLPAYSSGFFLEQETFMSRSTSRSRRPAAAAANPSRTGNGSGWVTTPPLEDGWQRTLDITRTLFGATLNTSQAWMRGLGDWQQAQAVALRHAGESIDEIASQAERAPDWPSLWTLQANLAGAQWTRAMQDCSELIDQAMQIEARLVERSRADAARVSQHWLGEKNGREPTARETTDESDANAPLALIAQAQQTMTEMSRLWTQALYRTTLPE